MEVRLFVPIGPARTREPLEVVVSKGERELDPGRGRHLEHARGGAAKVVGDGAHGSSIQGPLFGHWSQSNVGVRTNVGRRRLSSASRLPRTVGARVGENGVRFGNLRVSLGQLRAANRHRLGCGGHRFL